MQEHFQVTASAISLICDGTGDYYFPRHRIRALRCLNAVTDQCLKNVPDATPFLRRLRSSTATEDAQNSYPFPKLQSLRIMHCEYRPGDLLSLLSMSLQGSKPRTN